MGMTKKRWWVSWYHYDDDGPFEIHTPWWFSSETAVCAAVLADSEEEARESIYEAYDNRPDSLNWRFVEARDDGWTPWNPDNIENSRFQPADWMKWPGL